MGHILRCFKARSQVERICCPHLHFRSKLATLLNSAQCSFSAVGDISTLICLANSDRFFSGPIFLIKPTS